MTHPYGSLRTKQEVEAAVERRARPLRRSLATVTTQRDALLEAAGDVLDVCEGSWSDRNVDAQIARLHPLIRKLRAAIEAAESHQPARQADGPPSSACRRSEPACRPPMHK